MGTGIPSRVPEWEEERHEESLGVPAVEGHEYDSDSRLIPHQHPHAWPLQIYTPNGGDFAFAHPTGMFLVPGVGRALC